MQSDNILRSQKVLGLQPEVLKRTCVYNDSLFSSSSSLRSAFKPSDRKASAKLTAVVDFPTPPLPEATAMMFLIPGIAALWGRISRPGASVGRFFSFGGSGASGAGRWAVDDGTMA